MGNNIKSILWNDLWKDDRTYLKRLGITVFPCFLVSFMYLIWEPVNLFASNIEFFPFTFRDFLIPFLILGIAAFVSSSAIAALFRGRVFNWIICLIYGFSLASYLQAMFLNLDLGILDGTSIPWQSYSVHSVINILIWLLVILIPFVILYFFKNAWGKIVKSISIILIGAQAVALVMTLIAMPVTNKTTKYYLSGEEQYTVSSKSNVIVFVLDYFSNTYIDKVLAVYPDALDAFNDFTYYNNADCTYFGTFPSMNYMLTGEAMDTTVTTADWFKQSWNSDTSNAFYSTLAADNYKANVFASDSYFGGAENMLGKVSNVANSEVEFTNNISSFKILKKMLKLSCYNYVPHAFKASFWMDSDEFESMASEETSRDGIKNQSSYYSALKSQGLTLNNESNYYIFQHLRGTHPAYNVGEDGQYLKDATLEQTARGYLLMVEEYIHQLQELGVYDNSTIIITADHGERKNTQVIYFIKEASVTRDKMETSTTPISHNDFLPTVLANIGEDYSEIGDSIYDFSEDDKRERTVMERGYDDTYPDVPKYNSNANGTSNVYYAYTYIGDSQDLLEQIEEGLTEIIPMTDSFF